jgi:hypothetical protein
MSIEVLLIWTQVDNTRSRPISAGSWRRTSADIIGTDDLAATNAVQVLADCPAACRSNKAWQVGSRTPSPRPIYVRH